MFAKHWRTFPPTVRVERTPPLILRGWQSCEGLMDRLVPKRGLRPWVLLFFQNFMVKRKSLKHKRKQRLFFGNLSFAVNFGKSELPMTLKSGRKW
jgi:hypothetical protein